MNWAHIPLERGGAQLAVGFRGWGRVGVVRVKVVVVG